MPKGYNRDDVMGTTLRALSPCFTGQEIQLLLNIIGGARDRYQWQPMTDGEWDELDALFAEAESNLMVNCLIGSIVSLATQSLPENMLKCNGASHLRVDYPELYAVLNAEFITDADNFVTPDINQRFLRGTTINSEIGDTGGQNSVTLTNAQMPRHRHQYSQPTSNIDVESVGIPDPTGVGIPMIPGFNTTFEGSDEAHENQPRYMNVVFAIVAR